MSQTRLVSETWIMDLTERLGIRIGVCSNEVLKEMLTSSSDPGARVDTDSPVYQLFDKELWNEFTFTERYPGWRDLQRYFAFVEKKWDLRKDIEYNKNVEAASWDEVSRRWTVSCSDGTEAKCKWIIFSVGFASKQ